MILQRVLPALLICCVSVPTSAATLVFDFNEGTVFDGAGAGVAMTETDGLISVTLTSVDVLAPEYSSGVATGNILSASGGDGVESNIQSSTNAIGVNNPSVTNSAFETVGGPGSESRDFNLNEAWIIEFDKDVTISEFNFSSLSNDDQFEVTVEGVVLPFLFGDSGSADDYTDPLGSLLIPAGNDLTFRALGSLDNVSIRISEISVVAVPEPSALGMILVACVGAKLAGSRRKEA